MQLFRSRTAAVSQTSRSTWLYQTFGIKDNPYSATRCG